MSSFVTYSVTLTDGQKKKLNTAVKTMTPISLKFVHKNLTGKDPLPFTKTQYERINKAIDKGTGYVVKFSANQLKHVVSGGFLPFLIPAIAALATGALSGAASFGINKALQKATGSGMYRGNGVSEGFTSDNIQNANIVGKGKKKAAQGLFNYGQSPVRTGRGMVPL